MNKQTKKGFTLVELLMVLAVVGLLASILIPTAGSIRESALKTICKAQLSQYINAIVQFKSQYGYYPFARGNKDYVINLSDPEVSKEFIEIMSGRDAQTGKPASVGGNRKRIAFHDFSENEFYILEDDLYSLTQLADRFNNPNIYIMIDGDGDGFIYPKPSLTSPAKPRAKIRGSITAWVESDDLDRFPGYALWEN
ncbi:MAG: type II secretion system protein [Opitutales bacterium]|jgi:prepilin-type N-terminal cleavage/methylation domain-containing protein